ncbi:MAG: glutamine--tRNA ligase, partial [Planctomycetota bacterium]
NRRAPRRMCVLDPVRVVIENWGEHGEADRVEMMTGINNPEDEAAGTREIPFGGVLYVERDDYMDDAPKKWFRLTEGREVRLRYGYWITCREAVKENGELVELRCTYDPLTRGGDSPPADAEGRVRKVKGTLHWVAKAGAVGCRVRLIDRLFTAERPGKRTDEFMDDLNPEAMRLLEGCRLEPNWRTTGGERDAGTGVWSDGIERFQFERQGYFCVDACGAVDGVPVFNRTVPLRDSWSKSKGK